MLKSELIEVLENATTDWGDGDVVLMDQDGTEFKITSAYQSGECQPFFIDIDINSLYEEQCEYL